MEIITQASRSLQNSPIFGASAVQGGAGSADSPSDLRANGVILVAGHGAALVGVVNEAPQWIREGQSIHGQTLVKIDRDGIELRSASGQTTTISVYPSIPDARIVAKQRISPAG